MSIRIALFEPDIPQNAAAIIRTAVCFGLEVEIIEPCGFIWGEKHMLRVGLDYLETAKITMHSGWESFKNAYPNSRLILFTTKSEKIYTNFQFDNSDILIFGRETKGVPSNVHDSVDFRVTIPMKRGARSLNIAAAVAIAASESLRQLEILPDIENQET